MPKTKLSKLKNTQIKSDTRITTTTYRLSESTSGQYFIEEWFPTLDGKSGHWLELQSIGRLHTELDAVQVFDSFLNTKDRKAIKESTI